MIPVSVEIQGQLKKSGQVTLGANGTGVLIFDPDNANQRWEVTYIVVSTNQLASATQVPVATIALNSTDLDTMSAGNNRGATWSGNQDSFSGLINVGSGDSLNIIFGPAPGTPSGNYTYPSSATYPGPSLYPGFTSILTGVIASAIITGTKYTFRGYQ